MPCECRSHPRRSQITADLYKPPPALFVIHTPNNAKPASEEQYIKRAETPPVQRPNHTVTRHTRNWCAQLKHWPILQPYRNRAKYCPLPPTNHTGSSQKLILPYRTHAKIALFWPRHHTVTRHPRYWCSQRKHWLILLPYRNRAKNCPFPPKNHTGSNQKLILPYRNRAKIAAFWPRHHTVNGTNPARIVQATIQ